MPRMMKQLTWTIVLIGMLIATAIPQDKPEEKEEPMGEPTYALATFGGGCFWCIEACFEELEGVHSVVSGYAGGEVKDPTYKAVCEGTTGHAEVCRITYDPNVVSYVELLEVFWSVHDGTQLNRQGNDIGTQYRSVIFYHDDDQKKLAEEYKQKLDDSGAYDDPLVTEISPMEEFYPAENNHQNFFENNPTQGYCQAVVRPKVEKFRKVFKDRLKKEEAEK